MKRYQLTLTEMSGLVLESWTVTRDPDDEEADHQLDEDETSSVGRDIEWAMKKADQAEEVAP